MEIIDGQGHINSLGANWDKVDPEVVVERVVVAMDAIGLDALFIDEYTGFDDKMRLLPGVVLPNGALRSTAPFAEAAVRLYPHRFAYLSRVDPRDPDWKSLIAEYRKRPGLLALRVVAVPGSGHREQMEDGSYTDWFGACEANDMPVFCQIPERTPRVLVPYLEKFPKLRIIIDHCGTWQAKPEGSTKAAQLDAVFEMARFPNVGLKWCHAPRDLSAQPYPWPDVVGHLKNAIKVFGAERIMWACDTTISSKVHSWAKGLFYIHDSDQPSATEKEWILGKSVRSLLRWEKPKAAA